MNILYSYYVAEIKINGIYRECMMFNIHHDKYLEQELNENGYTVFEIRHKDTDTFVPASLERTVKVNFWGYLALRDKSLADEINRVIEQKGFYEIDDDAITLLDYIFKE